MNRIELLLFSWTCCGSRRDGKAIGEMVVAEMTEMMVTNILT